MMLSAVVVLLAVSKALSYTSIEGFTKHRPEILLAKWTPRDIYTLEKICQIVEVSKYRQNPIEDIVEDLEYDNIFVNKLATRKNLREIEHCCNKYTTHEKKQCMKEVRENYLDNYCDKGVDHTCCKTEYENRYTCFTKNPFRRTSPFSDVEFAEESWIPSTRRMQKEHHLMRELAIENMENPLFNELAEQDQDERFSYLERMQDIRGIMRPENRMEILAEDMLENERENRRWGRNENVEDAFETAEIFERQIRGTPFQDVAEWETLDTLNEVGRRCVTPSCQIESKIELDNEFLREKIFESERPCLESHQCRRRLEHATKAAAQQVCANKLYKGGRHQVHQCCRAGALVGKMVGRRNEQVCTPAAYKFQAKTQGCTNNRYECKQVFAQCCHERAERARDERMVEKDIIRERAIGEDLVRDEFLSEPTFYKRRTPFF